MIYRFTRPLFPRSFLIAPRHAAEPFGQSKAVASGDVFFLRLACSLANVSKTSRGLVELRPLPSRGLALHLQQCTMATAGPSLASLVCGRMAE